ncbi:cadherin repeat domain-containing protein, partial [Vibrio mediterranei]
GVDAGMVTVNANTGVVSMGPKDFEAPDDANGDHVYNLTLVATDADGNSASQVVTITVIDGVEVVNFSVTGLKDISVAENTTIAPQTATLSKPPIGSVTWSVTDQQNFSITPTGVLSFIGTLDYETTPAYSVTITAIDSDGNMASHLLHVTVNNVLDLKSEVSLVTKNGQVHPYPDLPSNGLQGASFQFRINGSSSNNGNYVWHASQSWLTIDKQGRVRFVRQPTSTTKQVSISIQGPLGGRVDLSFSIDSWLMFADKSIGGGKGTLDQAVPYCRQKGGHIPGNTEIENKYGSYWGAKLDTYSNSIQNGDIYWSSSQLGGSHYYYIVLFNGNNFIANGLETSNERLLVTCNLNL